MNIPKLNLPRPADDDPIRLSFNDPRAAVRTGLMVRWTPVWRRAWLTGLGLLTAAASFLTGEVVAQEKSPELVAEKAAMTVFMRQKLAYTQGVTEGLALDKLDFVKEYAVKLRDMTRTNIWTRIDQPDYLRLTKEYQATIEGVYMAAADRDLEAATEAYARTLKSCVTCHSRLRAGTAGRRE